MDNYYEILGLKNSAGDFKIFKNFRLKFLEADTDKEKALKVLKAYLVLQRGAKKFYDIVLASAASGNKPAKKYLDVVTNQEARASKLFEASLKNNKLLASPLKRYPLLDSALEFIGFLMQVEIGYAVLGILGMLSSIILSFWQIVRGEYLVFTYSVPLFLLCRYLHNVGVLKFRQENTESIIRKFQ